MHLDLVNLVSTHDSAVVDQFRSIVIDVRQVDPDSACARGWRLTFETTAKLKKIALLFQRFV